MNIIFEDAITDEIKSKYMILDLDTFYFSDIDKNKKAYCLIESAPIQEMFNIDKNLELHKNLIKNYYLRNWNYCGQAIEQLLGRWNGEVDSFYKDLDSRVQLYKNQDPDESWNGIIRKN
jgi:hypothetical protein